MRSVKYRNKFLAIFVALFFLAGCGIIPKPVEFFQDKVKAVPEATAGEKETQRQAADLAARKAEETLRAAIRESASDSIVKPAEDTSLLTRSVTTSLGPPLHPWNAEADLLAIKLDTAIAQLNKRLDKFTDKQTENVGKKIEGSGWFQVPWIVYAGGIALVIFFGLVAAKVALAVLSTMHPGVAVGTRVAQMGASTVSRALGQTIQGGKDFVGEITKKYSADVANEVIELFKQHQQKNQDSDVQRMIKDLIK